MTDVTFPDGKLLVGDCRERLAELEAGSVSLCVTSPPYFGLRAYSGVEPTIWGASDPLCEHEWEDSQSIEVGRNDNGRNFTGGGGNYQNGGPSKQTVSSGQTCRRCSAWLGTLGNESDLESYVAHLVDVFAAVKRVLHPSGVMVCNMGDSYAGGKQGRSDADSLDQFDGYIRPKRRDGGSRAQNRPALPGIPAKNLLEVPSRVALALQADGWILRSRMPWVKFGSAMPESTQDRPTTATEYIFLFAKQTKYFWDADSIRQRHTDPSRGNGSLESHTPHNGRHGDVDKQQAAYTVATRKYNPLGRSYRNSDAFLSTLDAQIRHHHAELVRLEKLRHSGGLMTDEEGEPLALLVNPEAQKASKPSANGQAVDHYASYPRDLVRPFVLAGSSQAGVCAACGASHERVTESHIKYHQRILNAGKYEGIQENGVQGSNRQRDGHIPGQKVTSTLGWRASCSCNAGDPQPSVVLDPFAGSGTTLVVARELGRRFVGIDQSVDYVALSARRLAGVTVGALAPTLAAPVLTQSILEGT